MNYMVLFQKLCVAYELVDISFGNLVDYIRLFFFVGSGVLFKEERQKLNVFIA